jgi:hypothetical protein
MIIIVTTFYGLSLIEYSLIYEETVLCFTMNLSFFAYISLENKKNYFICKNLNFMYLFNGTAYIFV